ncbi:MAG: hypothetical protein LBU07_03900 [Coriobacteriales bacterium]|jgi:4-diphosphocytidyl-2-C-methyl-D-erythritol kinase|nr:hypothetical protein [Coriobacteriales bacterium]
MSGSVVIAHAPAKINLHLAVSTHRDAGKHQLESIFCTLALADTIIFDFCAGSEPFSFTLNVEPLLPEHQQCPLSAAPNSMSVALECFEQVYGHGFLPGGQLEARLFKSIPAQAGLGGGSSDAAAMLRMLCWLAQVDPLAPQSLAAACQVGADVPFFLYAAKAGSCAWMGGVGDHLLQMLPMPRLDIVLVKPQAGISTRAAYQAFDANPQPPLSSAMLRQLLLNLSNQSPTSTAQAEAHMQSPVQATADKTPASQAAPGAKPTAQAAPGAAFALEGTSLSAADAAIFETGDHPLREPTRNSSSNLQHDWLLALAAACANNLEPAALSMLPQIAQLETELESCPGVLRALLCGSGSTVFALCANANAAQDVLKRVARPGIWALATST